MIKRGTSKERRSERTRKKIKLSGQLRLSVFRSNKYVYAQIIDDTIGKTLVSVSEKELKSKLTDKKQRAHEMGKMLAEKATKEKIKKIVFDKGPYKYHGRVQALAEGAREGGLKF